MPLHVSSSCAHHEEVKIALPPDDENMCSKHLEAWNKLIVKQTFCASGWLITEMHGQQNVKTLIYFSTTSIGVIGYMFRPVNKSKHVAYFSN
jgi:hypothetical protein